MKKVLLAFSCLIVIGLAAMKPLLGVSPFALGSAVAVSTGLGAKLACSGYFVSGQSPAQLFSDIESYSPANRLLDIDYDDQSRSVSVSLLGLAPASASYRDGLGYYESTRDTASHFFIDYLPKGTYVFEYSTRIVHRGQYQSGMAEIQCMYAPEFNSHSQSFELNVQ